MAEPSLATNSSGEPPINLASNSRAQANSSGQLKQIIPNVTEIGGLPLVYSIVADYLPSNTPEAAVLHEESVIDIWAGKEFYDKAYLVVGGRPFEVKVHKNKTLITISLEENRKLIGNLADGEIIHVELESKDHPEYSGKVLYNFTYKENPSEEEKAKRKKEKFEQDQQAGGASLAGAGTILNATGEFMGLGGKDAAAPSGKTVSPAAKKDDSKTANTVVEPEKDSRKREADEDLDDEEATGLFRENEEESEEGLDSGEQFSVAEGVVSKGGTGIITASGTGEVSTSGTVEATQSVDQSVGGTVQTSQRVDQTVSGTIQAKQVVENKVSGTVEAKQTVEQSGGGTVSARQSGSVASGGTAQSQVNSNFKTQSSGTSQVQAGGSGQRSGAGASRGSAAATGAISQSGAVAGQVQNEQKVDSSGKGQSSTTIEVEKKDSGSLNQEVSGELKSSAQAEGSLNTQASVNQEISQSAGGDVQVENAQTINKESQVKIKSEGVSQVQSNVQAQPKLSESGTVEQTKKVEVKAPAPAAQTQNTSSTATQSTQTRQSGTQVDSINFKPPASLGAMKAQTANFEQKISGTIGGRSIFSGGTGLGALPSNLPKKKAGDVGGDDQQDDLVTTPPISSAGGLPGQQNKGENDDRNGNLLKPQTEKKLQDLVLNPQPLPVPPSSEDDRDKDNSEESKAKTDDDPESADDPEKRTETDSEEDQTQQQNILPVDGRQTQQSQVAKSEVLDGEIKAAVKKGNMLLDAFLLDGVEVVWVGAIPSFGISLVLGAIVGDLLWIFKTTIVKKIIQPLLKTEEMKEKGGEIAKQVKISGKVKVNIFAFNVLVIGLPIAFVLLVLFVGCNDPIYKRVIAGATATGAGATVKGAITGSSDICKNFDLSSLITNSGPSASTSASGGGSSGAGTPTVKGTSTSAGVINPRGVSP